MPPSVTCPDFGNEPNVKVRGGCGRSINCKGGGGGGGGGGGIKRNIKCIVRMATSAMQMPVACTAHTRTHMHTHVHTCIHT